MKTTDSLKEYSYELPEGLIAREPVLPRDSSRLFAYRPSTGAVSHARFAELAELIPPGALLVLNETKVIPARITLAKKTGGKVEILFYVNSWDRSSRVLTGISDRRVSLGDALFFGDKEVCTVIGQQENLFSFELRLSPAELLSLLEEQGVMPIPKYIKETPLSEADLKERYQTSFAKHPGSVAAPTASLHFTPELFERLEKKGARTAKLTLHVGAGTFAPITDREISSGKLHEERFFIPEETIKAIRAAKKEGRPVIPVGTTSLRALESVDFESARGDIASATDIFIRKPYRFKVADGLITNFHVPESSLMCLVDAFLDFKGSKKGVVELYEIAVAERYRFFSFGDGMLIL